MLIKRNQLLFKCIQIGMTVGNLCVKAYVCAKYEVGISMGKWSTSDTDI